MKRIRVKSVRPGMIIKPTTRSQPKKVVSVKRGQTWHTLVMESPKSKVVSSYYYWGEFLLELVEEDSEG